MHTNLLVLQNDPAFGWVGGKGFKRKMKKIQLADSRYEIIVI
jgi:hypothetical protein